MKKGIALKTFSGDRDTFINKIVRLEIVKAGEIVEMPDRKFDQYAKEGLVSTIEEVQVKQEKPVVKTKEEKTTKTRAKKSPASKE